MIKIVETSMHLSTELDKTNISNISPSMINLAIPIGS